eukprot:m.87069 g.87069  ORF g.87069 m.87069 type:complete len:291 (+) comp16389_c0_seq1:128-1000(+)
MSRRRPARKALWAADNRMATFSNWPFEETAKCNARRMADAGFYCVGEDDNASCFMCGKDLDGWEEDDDPIKEHQRHSPSCAFVNLHLEDNRLKTFKFWPHKKYAAKAKDFARAGWVHVPVSDAWDMVRCFTCEKHLDGWEKDDDPMEEHKSHCASCPFIWASGASPSRESDAPADDMEMAGTANSTASTTDDQTATGADEASTTKDTTTSVPKDVDVTSPPTIPMAAGAETIKKHVDVKVSKDMTVEAYLKAHCEAQVHKLVQSCEAVMESFEKEATIVRQHLQQQVDAL